MHRTRSKGRLEYQIQKDIGGYIRKTRMEFLKSREMANPNLNPRLFGDCYKQAYEGNRDDREINAESYVIPPSLITLVQNGSSFHGLEDEDPHAHVRAFTFLSNTCKLQGVPQDELRRILFPFSLKGHAMTWFGSSGGYVIETFDELIREFITKYFPPAKMEKVRNEVYQL